MRVLRSLGWLRVTREGINSVTGIVGVLAIMVGGLFGAFEYLDRKEADRAIETLRMIDQWEEAGAQEAYQSLSSELERRIEAATPEQKEQLNDPLYAATARDNLARRALSSASESAYDRVIYFFSRLSLCVEADLCSSRVAWTFFGDSLSTFRFWFAGEISRRQQRNYNHARELEALSQRFNDLSR